MADFKKPLDRTGTVTSNLITNEPQTLANRQVRTAVPDFGAFFTKSLIVKDATSGVTLTRGVDYAPADLYPIPTRMYGDEICASIVIYNTTVSNNITLTYQCLGGEYSTSRTNIFAAIDALDLDDRPVAYADIVERPWYLPQGPHQHDTGDTYGWEYITRQIDAIVAGMVQGRQPTYDKINSDLEQEYQLQLNQNTALKAQLQAHVSDFNNPHELYAGQINVYTIEETDAILAALNTTFTQRSNTIISTVTTHNANKNNPHQVTPGQIDAYTTAEFQAKLAAAMLLIASGSNGSWVYLYSGSPGVDDSGRSYWQWTNPYTRAVVVSNSMAGQGNSGVWQEGYVNGQLISRAYNLQSSDSDQKIIQGIFKVPVGGSLTIYSNSDDGSAPPGRLLAYAFVPTNS